MLLCGILLGEEEVKDMEVDEAVKERIKEVMDAMGPTILISPVVNQEMSQELEEKNAIVSHARKAKFPS